MYFRDLQPYRYGLPVELPAVVTVGWLSSSNAFPIGEVSQDVLDGIKHLLSANRINKMRGYHLCEFCPHPEPITVELLEGPLILGSAEIWIASNDISRIYAAPDLIYHYVSAHHYLPPGEFLAAVAGAKSCGGWNPSKEREKQIQAAFASSGGVSSNQT
jgi:hypothetical protein